MILTSQLLPKENTHILQAKQSTIVIAVALVAGAVIGFAGSTVSYRQRWFRPPGERPFDRMSRSLGLSDVQRSQLRAVLEETKRELNQARLDYEAAQRRLMLKAYLRSRALLNPAQQSKFDRKFVPGELVREAQATARREAAASAAAVAGPALGPTPTPIPRGPVTSRSGA
jgi:hypothetical protein